MTLQLIGIDLAKNVFHLGKLLEELYKQLRYFAFERIKTKL